jgi:uncharacterized membrane protein
MDTPQIDDFLLWTAGVVIAVTAIAGGLAALYRLLTGNLSKRLDDIGSQLRRNGGSSLRDAIDRIEEKQAEIQLDVRDVRAKIDDHIAWHLTDKDR